MPSQRQIRFGEIIRSILSETLSKEYIDSAENNINVYLKIDCSKDKISKPQTKTFDKQHYILYPFY